MCLRVCTDESMPLYAQTERCDLLTNHSCSAVLKILHSPLFSERQRFVSEWEMKCGYFCVSDWKHHVFSYYSEKFDTLWDFLYLNIIWSVRFVIFQLIVLVQFPATLLFWFTLTALISTITRHIRLLFKAKISDPLYTTCLHQRADRQR